MTTRTYRHFVCSIGQRGLKKHVSLAVALSLGACASVFAQSYEFKNGYIFEQSYVKRISGTQADLLCHHERFHEYRSSFEWMKYQEHTNHQNVKRSGELLVISLGNGTILSLKSFSTKHGDGEWQKFKYLNEVCEYHVIGVEFGHDEPHLLLVEKSGKNVYFVNAS